MKMVRFFVVLTIVVAAVCRLLYFVKSAQQTAAGHGQREQRGERARYPKKPCAGRL
jgi:hypothetical protein